METLSFLYRINPRDIAYLRGTIECYDGMAVVKTLDPRAGVVEMRVAPGCEGLVRQIVDHLVRNEKLLLIPIEPFNCNLLDSPPA